ncbi:MAG: hypothetical protein LBL67_00900 [Coriobacteriales bacterium]|jgi:ech hydrogenase subunit A|nr:hypothetical protein [Coriobacteriales bacterium]
MLQFVSIILVPLLAALLLLVCRNQKARAVITITAAVLIIALSLILAGPFLFGGATKLAVAAPWHEAISYLGLAVDALLCVYIIAKGIYHRKWLAVVLAAVQLVLALAFELGIAPGVGIEHDLYIDQLSAIMILVIGVIGSLICIYAVGYMKDFQTHLEHLAQVEGDKFAADSEGERTNAKKQLHDRQNIFFSVIFAFLAGMFALVLCNNLTWLLCAWEVTTTCSFALIGYTRTPEAIRNSFRQIVLNLIGGIAFVVALICLALGLGIGQASGASPFLELDRLIASGSGGLSYMLPVALLAVAAFTKAAQVPFHSWLLGAMVAPTPTSALLHSSTMVKAGVFLLIKLAPCFGFNFNGMLVMLIGGISFLFCSAVAIAQTNSKRVLAYSTIANLGLIVLCAGIGTPEAVWTAIFLLIFHACAKALLFCCVGTAEHHIGSRQIEVMDNLFRRMPKLACLMALGMFIMFVAPFGMLVSKWATISALADTQNIGLIIVLAFGSALTFVFWAKWLGKVLAIGKAADNVEKSVNRSEWWALAVIALVVAASCLLFPLISNQIVLPYLQAVAGGLPSQANPFWQTVAPAISYQNLLVMAVLVAFVFIAFAIQLARTRSRAIKASAILADGGRPYADVYMAGAGLDFAERSFSNSFSEPLVNTERNWYLVGWFGDDVWTRFANVICTALIIVGVVLAAAGYCFL